MCGRYTLRTPVDSVAEAFEIEEYPSSITPNYNIAPTQEVAAVVEEDEKRKLEMLHWGLIPSWAKDPSIGNKMINARAETVAEKPPSAVPSRSVGASSSLTVSTSGRRRMTVNSPTTSRWRTGLSLLLRGYGRLGKTEKRSAPAPSSLRMPTT